jgi:hypothetical protein
MAMAPGFEADAVDRAIHFRLAQQCGDLFVQRRVFRQVDDFKTLCPWREPGEWC